MVALPLTERIALSVLQAVVLIACGCTIHQNYWLIPLIPTVLLVVFGGTFLLRESLLRLDYLMDETLAAQAEMTEEESRKSSHLLKTVLPSRLIQGLLSDPSATLYEEFPLVTVLQMDIMGFTAMSSLLDPLRVFQMINNMFTYFDALTAEYGVEKITTIGDAYVACSSLTVGTDQRLSATAVCLVALLMQAFVNEKLNASPFMKTVLKHQCAMRIGVHTGPCYGSIAGGSTNFRFDLGGSTVDIAEKIQEHCEPGEVYISRVTRDLITFNTAFDIVDKNLCTAGEEIFLLRLKKLW
ncbi:nucleotide cyclase [Zopfochytrium polystomum]|nr:nucleotide cyclase [Zopfochytrium polystomum]